MRHFGNIFYAFHLPIVHCSARVSAVFDIDHKNGEAQKPHAHAKADAVHSLVADEHFTVHVCL